MQVPDEDTVWEVVDIQSMFGTEIHLKEELSKKKKLSEVLGQRGRVEWGKKGDGG